VFAIRGDRYRRDGPNGQNISIFALQARH
jgi:hypothetical protein